MCKKIVVLSVVMVFAMMLSLAGSVQAANPNFDDGDAGDSLWGTADNWDTGSVPGAGDNPHILRSSPGVIIPNGYNAVGAQVFMAVGGWVDSASAAMTVEAGGTLTLTGGLNLAAGGGVPVDATVTNSGAITAPAGIAVGYQSAGCVGTFNQNGGTVNTNGHIILGNANGSTGTFNMNGGTVTNDLMFVINNPGGTGTLNMTDGTLNSNQWFQVGFRGPNLGTANISGGTINTLAGFGARIGEGGNGLVDMTGGILNANDFSIATFAGGTGHLQLDGGTINATAFAFGGGTGTMDINGPGTLVIDGDVSGLVAGYIGSGLITALNGSTQAMYDFGVTNPGQTTVFIPEPATLCLLGFGAMGLLRKRKL